jgi:hypothetical protein
MSSIQGLLYRYLHERDKHRGCGIRAAEDSHSGSQLGWGAMMVNYQASEKGTSLLPITQNRHDSGI